MNPRTPLLTPELLARLERLELSVRRLARGDPRGEIATRQRGHGLLFQDHRPYVPGDDPRLLDWNAYLRLGELLVREAAAEESPRLVCLVDVSRSMSMHDGRKLHFAKRVAAALGAVSLLRGQAVSIAVFPLGREPASYFGREQLWSYLEAVSAIRDSEVRGEWNSSLEAVLRATRSRGIACVISDFFAEADPVRALAQLRRRGFSTKAIEIIDDEDERIAPGERVLLRDAETGRVRQEKLDSASVRRYVQLLREHRERLQTQLKAERIAHRRANTTDDLESVMVDLLRQGTLSD